MSNIRIIPRLDIKGPNLVKGIHLEGLRVLGKPEDYAQRYYEEGADELMYIDVVASLYGRQNLLEIVERAARNIYVPLTAGGGIRTIDDIRDLLRAGADKVAINTAATKNPQFISEGANAFGAQCIVLSIEAKSREKGKYEAFTDNGREKTGRDVFEWAKEAVDLGAGEVLITSIDQDGTGSGYDAELVRTIAEAVPVPVIACGGAGKPEHLLEVIQKGKADAVSAASIFHYHRLEVLKSTEEFKDEGNIEFIKQSRGAVTYLKDKIQPSNVSDVQKFLQKAGVACRLIDGVTNGSTG